jgi:hypothetical protein
LIEKVNNEAIEVFEDFFNGHIDFFSTTDKSLSDAIENRFILSEMDYHKLVKFDIKYNIYI